MAIILALPKLFDDVVARFLAESVAVPNVFGWRKPAQRSGTTKRIVWVPGNDGALGELVDAHQPGRNPRPIATLRELFTVLIEAHDPSGAEDERKQYQAARELFDAWYRAVYLAARGNLSVVEAAWVDDKNERRFGAALRVVASIGAMIPDEESDIAPAETAVEVATSLLNVTETTKAAAPVRVATTAPIVLSGLQVVDGVALLLDERVLVKNQAAAETNGIYLAKAAAWVRAADADTSAEVPPGLLVYVVLGAENRDAEFVLTTPAPIVLGTTPLTFARMT